MNRKKINYTLIIFIYGILFGLLLYFFKLHKEEIIGLFSNMKWHYLLFILLLQIPMIALGGLTFHLIAIRFKVRQHWYEWVGLSFIANLLNHLLPYRPGLLFRYLYLRKHYQIKTQDYVYISLLFLSFMVFVGSLFILWNWLWGRLILLVVCLCFTFFAFYKKWLVFFLYILPVVMLHLFAALIFYLLFIALNFSVSVQFVILMAGTMGLAALIPITPGNIGILESFAGALTLHTSNDFTIGFSVIALFRISQWIPSLILGMSFSLLLIGRLLPAPRTLESE